MSSMGMLVWRSESANSVSWSGTGWAPSARAAIPARIWSAVTAADSSPFPLLVGIAIAAGMVRGNLTLLQTTAVPDGWGATHYDACPAC